MLNALLVCALAAARPDTNPIVLASASPPVDVPAPTVPARVAAPSRPPNLAPLRRPKSAMVVADSLVLDKSERQLTLFFRGERVAAYGVALGRNPVGDKMSRGDGRTPEGLFRIIGHNPQSKYHLALRLSYPDAAHAASAARRGVSPGGDIMIHGLPPAFAMVGALHREQDWTEGCIAVTNAEIEEIWRAVPDGARILIKP